jgi:hypothetical protein
MLHAILHELQTASRPMTLRQLSRKLGVQESALEGMIDFWVQKGRLERSPGAGAGAEVRVCSGGLCALRTCPGPDRCPLSLQPPREARLAH